MAGETGIGEIQAVDYVKGKERSSLSLSLSLSQEENRNLIRVSTFLYIGLIAVAAKGIVAVYRLQEEFGLPKWNQIAILPP